MPAKKYIVTLKEEERKELLEYVKENEGNKRQKTRVLILLRADEGMKDADIVKAIGVGMRTVERTRQRFVEGNIEGVLKEAPRTQTKHITAIEEAKIIALACSEAPEGQARWSLRLLADKAVELNYIETISHEGVRQILKKTNLNLGEDRCGVLVK